MATPKIDDSFNAYTKQFGNLVIGAPFVCTKIDEKNYTVYADDVVGNRRKFFTKVRHYPDWAGQDWTCIFEVLGQNRV